MINGCEIKRGILAKGGVKQYIRAYFCGMSEGKRLTHYLKDKSLVLFILKYM